MYKHLGDVDPIVFRGVIEELQKKPLEMNCYRKNSGEGRSQCFGYVRQRNGTTAGSRNNFKRPELYQELLSLASKVLPPTLEWMSIQVNINYQTEPHLDRGNKGESAILGFGEYSGGDIVINGEHVDIKNKLVLFDGSQLLHSTLPFTGTRYSIVYHMLDRNFLEIPRYSFVIEEDSLVLREDMRGITRFFNKKGRCVFASDGVIPRVQKCKPTLRPCIENVRQ